MNDFIIDREATTDNSVFTEELRKLFESDYVCNYLNSKYQDLDLKEVMLFKPIQEENTIMLSVTNRFGKIRFVKTPKSKFKKVVMNTEQIVEYIDDLIYSTYITKNDSLVYIFSKLGVKGNVFYTSYGIQLNTLFRSEEYFNREVGIIRTSLNTLGIKYIEEWSDAMWVYRFKFSKSVENLDKIKSLA